MFKSGRGLKCMPSLTYKRTPPFFASVGVLSGVWYPSILMSTSGVLPFKILDSDIQIMSNLKLRKHLKDVTSHIAEFFKAEWSLHRIVIRPNGHYTE